MYPDQDLRQYSYHQIMWSYSVDDTRYTKLFRIEILYTLFDNHLFHTSHNNNRFDKKQRHTIQIISMKIPYS